MQYITPRDDTSTLSLPERTFLRSAARGILPPSSSRSSSSSSSSSNILRLDGRKPSESRPIRLSFSRCHNRSECVVQLGSGTRSAASVRAELVPPPNADRPNDGQVKFGVDVGPMGCMGFEAMDRPVSNYGHSEAVDGGAGGGGGGGGDAPYVQRIKSNRILRVLERTLLIGGAIDAEALCVTGGSWVWRLHVDVGLLDDGGNSVDACILAAVAALRHYRLPEVSVVDPPDDDGGDGGGGRNRASIIHSDDREPSPLPLHHTPLTATFALFADETGASSSVSALLDPSDREELACDGLLTWAYNRHGEMCCLDFPGGCELRPRRLLSIATMGRDRCVESCEMLETALAEAEGRAQAERMERLRGVASASVDDDAGTMTAAAAAAAIFSDAMCVDGPLPPSDEGRTDAAARNKEEEEYRARALDYGSGHFAASVKEDKDGSDNPGRKYARGDASSLFNAILRSARSSALSADAPGNGGLGSTIVSDGPRLPPRERDPAVEIIAHRVKGVDLSKVNGGKIQDEGVASSSQSMAIDSDEDEVVQLQTEFSSARRDAEAGSTSPIPPRALMTATTETGSDATLNDEMPDITRSGGDGGTAKDLASGIKSKSKPVEEDDITDLAQALKKKKKSKKSKK